MCVSVRMKGNSSLMGRNFKDKSTHSPLPQMHNMRFYCAFITRRNDNENSRQMLIYMYRVQRMRLFYRTSNIFCKEYLEIDIFMAWCWCKLFYSHFTIKFASRTISYCICFCFICILRATTCFPSDIIISSPKKDISILIFIVMVMSALQSLIR